MAEPFDFEADLDPPIALEEPETFDFEGDLRKSQAPAGEVESFSFEADLAREGGQSFEDSLGEFVETGDVRPEDSFTGDVQLLGRSIFDGVANTITDQLQMAGRDIASDPFQGAPSPLALAGGPAVPGAKFLFEGFKLINEGFGEASEKFGTELQVGSAEFQEERETETQALATPGSLKDEVIAGVGTSLGTTIPSLFLGGTSQLAALASMGYIAASDAELRALEEGHSLGTAKVYGLVDGLIEAGTEKLSLGALFGSGTFKRKLASFLFREEVGELSATFLQKLNEQVALNPNKNSEEFWNELKRDLQVTALTVPFAGGAQVAGVQGVVRGAQTVDSVKTEYARLTEKSEERLRMNRVQRAKFAEVNRETNNVLETQRGIEGVSVGLQDERDLARQRKVARTEAEARVAKNEEFQKALKEKFEEPAELKLKKKYENLRKAVELGVKSPEARFVDDVTNFNAMVRWTAGLETVADLNIHVPGMAPYRDGIRGWWRERAKWIDRGDQRLQEIKRAFRFKNQDAFNRYMDEAQTRSTALGRQLDATELSAIQKDLGIQLTDNQAELATNMWEDYREMFNEVESAVIANVQATVNTQTFEGELKANEQIALVRAEFAQLRNQNFMPRSNFGQYSVKVLAKEDGIFDGVERAKGDQIWYSTHAREDEAVSAAAQQESLGRGKAQVGKISEAVRSFQGIPSSFLNKLEEKLDLSRDQQAELELMQQEASATSAFMRKLKSTVDVPGYSADALRSYAHFTTRFANKVARLKFDRGLEKAINNTRQSTAPNMVKRTELAEWMSRHRDYMRDPGTELATLRSMGFLWYLGMVPKSAVVNLSQLSIVTMPYLNERFGHLAAPKAMTLAMTRYFNVFKKGEKLSLGETGMVEELRARGILDESQATELGAMAGGSQVAKLTDERFGTGTAGRVSRAAVDTLSWMFHKTEVINRYITALAAYELATKKGQGHAEAVDEAHRAVRKTHFEYSRYNRPELMRGKKSAIFIFMQYVSNMMWFIGTEPAKWEVLGMLLLLGGIEGLPLVGNFQDVFDGVMTQIGKKAGWKDPHVNSREAMRSFIEDLANNPPTEMQAMMDSLQVDPRRAADYVMKGASQDILGSGIDLSGSVSLGDILPGTSSIRSGLSGTGTDARKLVGQTVSEASGALGQIPIAVVDALATNSPDALRMWERAMPAGVRNLARANRYRTRRVETDSRGSPLVYFDPAKDWPQLIAQAGGFPLTQVNRAREAMWAYNDSVKFYGAWADTLRKELKFALAVGDADREKLAWSAIRDYDSRVPFPEMNIMSGIKDVLVNDAKKSAYREAGAVRSKKLQGLYEEKTGPYGTPIDLEGNPARPP